MAVKSKRKGPQSDKQPKTNAGAAARNISALSGNQPALAAGRALPKLLFATSRARLSANLGAQPSQQAIDLIQSAGQKLYDVQNPNQPFAEVARASQGFAGVVILGGYDVLPALRLDALDAKLRQQVGMHTQDDDNFIVWSDELYGDQDGDGIAEIPVSRIPDAKDSLLMLSALCANRPAGPAATRFGLRNIQRPFADAVYPLLAGTKPILTSTPTTAASVNSADVEVQAAYFMLHGDDKDTSRFWGEKVGGDVEAFNAGLVPASCSAIVLVGCCWGALTVKTIARNYTSGQALQQQRPANSIALSFLKVGALAFVGCTGSHYSPLNGTGFFGQPMHEAFWQSVGAGTAPAKALFEAKQKYARGLPHGQTYPFDLAIESKILRQFTCLGLGW